MSDAAPPAGASLAELLAALTLAGLIGTLLCGSLVAQLRLARHAADRVAAAEAVRTAAAVVDGELRRITPADLRAAAADSLAIRVVRGTAVACATRGAVVDVVDVRYRGDRLPDPRKDSVLVVDGTGRERALQLLDSRHAAVGGCPTLDGEQRLEWRLPEPIAGGGILVVFESGSYYLTNRALRYRLGAEGRQPVTAELFVNAATRFDDADHRGVRIRLVTTRGDSVSALAAFAGSRP